jgi:magnesium-transporting ATPase (P-type)
MVVSVQQIIPQFFGLAGICIVGIFFALVWYWMKTLRIEAENMKMPAHLMMTGYTLLLMATWFTCGMVAWPGYALRPAQANYEFASMIAYIIIILVLLGFTFILIGQRLTYMAKRRGQGNSNKNSQLGSSSESRSTKHS